MDVDVAAVRSYLQTWISSRRSPEAYVEPATHVSPTSIVVVAHDGEWTRRAVPGPQQGFALAKELGLPVYDVNQTGYPARMRAWSSKQARKNKPR